MHKLVSVVIPTYNRESTIEISINSILNQTYKNIEIIVVDDNSNDNTHLIVQKLKEKYDFIKYIKHENNRGGSAARNTGAKAARGEFLAFLDSDDEWIDTKLEKCMNVFENDSDISMIYSDMILYNVKTGKEKINISEEWKDKYKGVLCKNIIGSTSLIVIRKNVFDKVKGFKEGLPSCQDWDFYINVAKDFKIMKVNEPLLKYYIHDNSISGDLKRVIEGHKYILNKVSNLLIDEDSNYYKERNKIISEQYINIAMIYRKFGEFNLSRKYYLKAFNINRFNKKAIKNLVPMLFGKNLYSKLREK